MPVLFASRRLSSLLLIVGVSLLLTPSVHAAPEAFERVGQYAIVERLHIALDTYRWARMPIVEGDGLRVDVMTMGMTWNQSFDDESTLALTHTGHILGAERVWRGLGFGFFRSSAGDYAYTDDFAGGHSARTGRKWTVMGGQVWWADWVAVAVGYIRAPRLHTYFGASFDDVIEYAPVDALPPLFLRIDLPRWGGSARVDLFGAKGSVGNVYLGVERLRLAEYGMLDLHVGRRLAGDRYYAQSTGYLKGRVVGGMLTAGVDDAAGLNRLTGGLCLCTRMSRVGGDVLFEGRMEAGAAQVPAPGGGFELAFAGQFTSRALATAGPGSFGVYLDYQHNMPNMLGGQGPSPRAGGLELGATVRLGFGSFDWEAESEAEWHSE